jgi:hypothetical protein
MIGDLGKRLQAVDKAALTPLVRRVLEDDTADVVNWHWGPVEGGFGRSYGVFRFQGEAQSGGETATWSLILKVAGPASGSQDPAALDYWKREVLAYQSGLLDDLEGDLVAARCVSVAESPNEEFWLWLEDVVDRSDQAWSFERFGSAARHLGQFNGGYLAGEPIPELPWLSSDGLRKRLDMAEAGVAELPRLSHNPLFAGLSTEDGIERILGLWADREHFLALLDRLPRVLCHHDAFRRNLMSRQGRDGREQTVAIDWAAMGPGVVGEEIVPLFAGSLRFVPVDVDRIPELDDVIFTGYLGGLRDAGWHRDTRLVRYGYAATAALRTVADRAIKWPRVARRAAALPAGAEPPRLLNAGGRAQAAAVHQWLLDLGNEARALIDVLSSEQSFRGSG